MDDAEETADTFAETMDGLNRAVEWVRTHLAEFPDMFSIDTRPGGLSEISFGCCFSSCQKKQRAIEALFAGKQVTRTYDSGGDMTYKYMDSDAQIEFRWYVYASPKKATRETETITL